MTNSLYIFIGVALLAGLQNGVSGDDSKTIRQGALQLPGGSVLLPYGQGQYGPAPPQYYPDPYYPDPYYPGPYYPELPNPTKPNTDITRLLLLLYLFMDAFKPATTTTTTVATPTTTFPGTCQWGAWTACSSICRGIRSRTRMCVGGMQFDSQMCNDETGFLPDGNWYRAANCYDYFWSTATVTSKAAATTACTNLGARLASLGLRTEEIRTDIVSKFATTRGIDNIADAYVGINNDGSPTTYVWTDGHVGDPTFWQGGEPTGTATACILLAEGNAFGLYDQACDDSPYSYLCERAAQ